MDQENTIPLQTVQNGLFAILQYIRDVCDRNGLRYYLAYGTLIGAVRHQGFIPWDDDMDVHMPREDFLRFADILKQEPHPYYRLLSKETSSEVTRIIPKMIDSRTRLKQNSPLREEKIPWGIFVDIFILDGAGNTRGEAEATYRKAFSLFSHWRRTMKKMFVPGENSVYTFLVWFKHIPEKIMGCRYWIKKHDAFCKRKAYDDCIYVSALDAGTKEPDRNIWKREWFGEGTAVTFNGETFRAPANWDAVLRPEYGDYMTPPPQEERNPKHFCSLDIPDPGVLEELSGNKTNTGSEQTTDVERRF